MKTSLNQSGENVPTVYESIENIFLRRNPTCKREDLQWRSDGRLEWCCQHGIGHTVFSPLPPNWVHGCDGCCNFVKFEIVFHLPKEKEK